MLDEDRHCIDVSVRIVAFAGLVSVTPAFAAAPLSKVLVRKDPNCGCCQNWADHLTATGFAVEVVASEDMPAIKAQLGGPDDLSSCHTAELDGYAIEGHVPASAILRLLMQKPNAIGLAVPGMPAGSPGMEGGIPELFEVSCSTSLGTRASAARGYRLQPQQGPAFDVEVRAFQQLEPQMPP